MHRLLLDVSSAEFKGAQPIEVDAFKTWQAECTEHGKAGLWTSWLPKCVEVFRRLLPIFINGNSDAYYSSIATLQVLLICSTTCRFADIHVPHANTRYAEELQPVFITVNLRWQSERRLQDSEENVYIRQNPFTEQHMQPACILKTLGCTPLSLMRYLADNVVLQSNQLRQLAQDSLNSYVAFFEQYRPATKPAVAKADGEQVQSHASCIRATWKHAVCLPCPLDDSFGLYSLLTSDCC